jgi:hypothetical protein
MKRIFGMKYRSFTHGFVAALLGLAPLAAVAAANDVVVQTAGSVTYVSGGVGAESIDQLTALSRDFNLKLVFALNSGAYVSDVNVAIADAAGRPMLNATSSGPWFLTKLPAGNYRIAATFAGTSVIRQVVVDAARLSTIDMRWASE